MISDIKITGIIPALILLLFIGCKPPQVTPPDDKDDDPITMSKYFQENSWIYNQMKENYLWSDQMPAEDKTDKNLTPENYFYSLLYTYKDRYSYFKEDFNDILDYWNGTLESYGFRYTRFRTDSLELGLAVSLVLKGSPAEAVGMERGDIIEKIDGQFITINNIDDLLTRKNAIFSIRNLKGSHQLEVSKRKFQLQPNQFYTILESEGKKVGYWVYVQFLFDFEEETRNIFKYFKENEIDELIVDFRFNPGGVTPNAEVIASLLGPSLGSGVPLFYGQVSSDGKPVGNSRNFTDEINNLPDLSRIFVLTSNSSASSSELVIQCLKPYRQTITVGSHTYGKNIISIVLTDDKYKFGLMPAWVSIFDANGGKSPGDKNGIRPDYPVSDNILPYKPLGDKSETLLNAALRALGEKIEKTDGIEVELQDSFHYFDTGTGFLGNERYN